jgi:hypothetical protein
MSAGNGYTAQVELDRGDLVHATSTLTNGNDLLGSGCQVDDQADAVVPFKLTVTNTTKGFSSNPAVAFYVSTGYPLWSAADLETEDVLGTMPQCVNLSATWNGVPDQEPDPTLGPGESEVTYGFMVAHHYYSPASPGGEPSQLAPVLVRIAEDIPNLNTYAPTTSTGTLKDPIGGLPAVPFDPADNGGCTMKQDCESQVTIP